MSARFLVQARPRVLAGLCSLIATCEVNGINAVAYLADVLIRVRTHPASRIGPRTYLTR